VGNGHSAIDSLIAQVGLQSYQKGGEVGTAKESFERFWKNYYKPSTKGEHGEGPNMNVSKELLHQAWEESGSPYIKEMDLEGFKRYGNLFESGEPRAFFKTDRYGSPELPDTAFTEPGNFEQLVKELSHQMQYGPLSGNQVGELEYRRREEEKEFGQDVYKRFDTMEGEAHNIIEPTIRKRFKTLLDSLSAPITVESLFQNQ